MSKLSQLSSLFLLMLSLILPGGVQAVDLETRTNREGAVTVKVTPKSISPGAKSWDFEITLSTHSVPLNQDMARVSALVSDSGNPQSPLAWDGDPPGGHHRKGVLRFQPPSVMPQKLELQINGIGGVNLRVFRWVLAK